MPPQTVAGRRVARSGSRIPRLAGPQPGIIDQPSPASPSPGGPCMSAPAEFTVWAPLPERVRIQVDGAVHDMSREAGGWWRAEGEAGPEADYGFLLDETDTPRPDPRSRRQPDGVHGLSRRFDPNAHEWGDTTWTGRPLAGGVVYE